MFQIKIEFMKYGEMPELLVDLRGDNTHHDHDLRESIKRFVYPVLMDRFLHPQLPDEELDDKTWIEIKLNDKEHIFLELKFRNFRVCHKNSKGELFEVWRGWETKNINEVINLIEERAAAYEARN